MAVPGTLARVVKRTPDHTQVRTLWLSTLHATYRGPRTGGWFWSSDVMLSLLPLYLCIPTMLAPRRLFRCVPAASKLAVIRNAGARPNRTIVVPRVLSVHSGLKVKDNEAFLCTPSPRPSWNPPTLLSQLDMRWREIFRFLTKVRPRLGATILELVAGRHLTNPPTVMIRGMFIRVFFLPDHS